VWRQVFADFINQKEKPEKSIVRNKAFKKTFTTWTKAPQFHKQERREER